MTEQIRLLSTSVLCPMCCGHDIRIKSVESVNTPATTNDAMHATVSVQYECMSDCGHKFNVKVKPKNREPIE